MREHRTSSGSGTEVTVTGLVLAPFSRATNGPRKDFGRAVSRILSAQPLVKQATRANSTKGWGENHLS
jgi:hypothetical protein